MHPTNCLNCGTILTADDKFCPNCGQKTDVHRITIGHIIHEFFHNLTHADKGFFAILVDLTVRPGKVAQEYIAGKRKKYFNPFTFFVIVMGIFVLANNVFHPQGDSTAPDPRILKQIPTEEGRQAYIKAMERSADATHFMQKNGNLISMIALPIFTLLTWMFFMRRGYNYAEIFVANMLYLAVANLMFTLLVTPWLAELRGKPSYFVLLFGGLFLQSIYIGWAQYQFFSFKNRASIILTWLASLFTIIVWTLLSVMFLLMYVYPNDWWRLFKKMISMLFN